MKRILALALAAGLLISSAPTATIASSGPATYLCMIVLDAGRPDYITNNLGSMPNMRALLQHSRWYDRAFVGDLMSITPPGHAVIGTGSMPKNDGGLVNWDWGIHSTGKISPTLQDKKNYQNNWAFNLMKRSGTPTLSAAIHSKYSSGLVIAGSGAHFHAAGPMGGPDANWIFSYDRINGNWAPYTLGPRKVPARLLSDRALRAPLASSNGSTLPLTYDPLRLGQQDSLVVNFAIKSLQLYRPRGIMINLPEVDTAGHWSSRWLPEEARLYRSFDQDLGRLINAYKAAGIYNQTLFAITADHGMIQIKNHRVLDRTGVINLIESTVGKHSIILTNGGGKGGPTMTSIWLKNQNNNKKAATAIFNHHFDNVSAVFYIKHSGGHYYYNMAGCTSCTPDLVKSYRYLLGTEAGPTGEDVAILLRENTGNSGLPQMYGRHGGADWGSQHITLMLSGPGVQSGTSHHPARLADIAPTVERLMGIQPLARDGVVLADAFQQPVTSDISRQTSIDAKLNPLVNALSARGQRDLYLERHGQLPNSVPSDEIIIHWKRRWAVTIAGGVVILGTFIGLWWAIAEVRRQGTGLKWSA